MAYAQNTIISANASNELVTALQGLLTSAGWTLVETITPSGTYRTQAWKSAGADNEAGYDWYTVLKWNTVGTEQCVEIVSGAKYDATTHTLSMIPQNNTPPAAGVYSDGDMYGGYIVNTAVDLSTVWVAGHGENERKAWFNSVTPSSAFAYWASVTLDHVTLFTTITPGGANYYTFYHASTLDVDAGYAALGYTATNPLYSYNGLATGVSALVKGPVSGTLAPTAAPNKSRGTVLPILSDDYQPAYAWKEALYVNGMVGSVAPGWTNGSFDDGIYIGSSTDSYTTLGGSIGDTIDIASDTYVICPMPNTQQASGLEVPTVAVLVE